MAKIIKPEILEEMDLLKNRPEVSFDANKENYFVFNVTTANKKSGLVDAYDDFEDFYESRKRTIRFKRRRKLKKQLKLLPFTLVKTDNIEYTISDKKGREKVVVLVEVIDTDPVFSKKHAFDNPKPSDLPVLNTSYYIEKRFLHPIDPERIDPAQSKVLIDASKGKKKKTEDWHKQPNDTILETDDSIYVIKETIKQTWEDEIEQRAVYLGTKEAALDFFIQHYKIKASDERRSDMLYKCKSAGIYVSSRPKAKCKMLLQVPRQLLTVEDETQDFSEINISHTLENLTLGDLIKNTNIIIKYLKGVSLKVKKENISLDLSKEADNFAALVASVVRMFESNKTYPATKDEKIAISFGGDDINIVGIQVYPKGVEDYLYPSDGIPSKKEKDQLSQPFNIKINKSFTTNKSFKNKRSMFFLINSDLMVKDIDLSNPTTHKWYDIVSKYTYNMPEYRPSAKKTNDDLNISKNISEKINLAQTRFTHGMIHSAKEAALGTIGPVLKESIGEMQRTIFEKIEDPTLKMVLNNIEQINSIDSLYELVLDKIPTDKLLQMATNAVSSKVPRDVFLDGAIDSVNNIESMDFSANSIKDTLMRSDLADEGFFGKALDISDKFKEGFSFDLSSGKSEIFDVTEGKDEEIFGLVKDIVTSTIVETVKTILRTIKNNIFNESVSEKTKKIGSYDIKENIKNNDLFSVKNNINSLPDVFIENADVSKILKIISDLATPLEILAIFEGRGDLEVIDIICTDIAEQYPSLASNLVTIYEKEDFLMLIGKDILDEVTKTIGENNIKENKEKTLDIDFCADDEAEDFVDHLAGRFPEQFLKEQEAVREQAEQELKDLIDGISTALENDNLEDLLFGGKIRDLLNSIVEDNRSSDFMLDMVVKGYFGPIQSIYELEAVNPGNVFITENIVSDTNPTAPLDPSVQMEINRLGAFGDKDGAEELRKKAREGKKKINLGLKGKVEELRTSFQDKPCVSNAETNSYILGKSSTNIEVSFSDMQFNPLTGSLTKPLYKDLENTPTPDFATYSIKANLNGNLAIDSTKQINLKETIMNKKGYLDVKDFDMPPRKAAFLSFMKETIEEEIDFGFFGDLSVTQEDIKKVLDDMKDHLFDWSTQSYVNFLAEEASRSPFFKIQNLKKLKFTPTDGDTRVPPLACDELQTEEAAKVQSNQDELIKQIILLDDIQDSFAERKKYFSVLEREQNEKIFDRSDIDNALLMEITESFFKVIALEFLISGVFVYSEINVQTLLKDKNNFKLMQDIMFFTMQRLGDEFRNKFSEYLKQYIEIKKDMLDEDAPIGDDVVEQKLSDLNNIGAEDTGAIINYIFKEQIFNIFEDFQKSVQLVSDKQKLEVNEFLDIVPNIDIAWSSQAPPDRNRFKIDPALNRVKTHGGFILERYIRAEYEPTKEVQKLTDFIINRKNVIKIPSYGIDGNFQWLIGGTEDQIDTSILDKFLKQQSGVIYEKASQNIYSDQYSLYVKKGGTFEYKIPQVLPKDEIFDILAEQAAAQGDVFLKTLPGYQDLIKQLKEAGYTPTGENVAYEYPSYDGAVNLSAFEEIQDYVRSEINKDLTDKLDSSIDKYTTLVNDEVVFNTLNEELLELKAEWNEEYNIIKNNFISYTEKFTSPYIFEMPNPGGFPDPHPFSDEDIFNWQGKEEQLKKQSPKEKVLYNTLNEEIQNIKTNVIDILLPRMKTQRNALLDLVKGFEEGKIDFSDQVISNYKNTILDLGERIKELDAINVVENFNEIEDITEKVTSKEVEIEELLDGETYGDDIKQFFVSQIAAAEEAQQKAFNDYNTIGIFGSHTELFKPLKYGIRLSYVYPGTDGFTNVNNTLPTKIKELRKNFDKVAGQSYDKRNYDEKSLKIKEIFFTDQEKQSVDNINIYSIPLIEVEDEITNYFTTSGENSYIPLTHEGIVKSFPSQQLKNKMLNNELYNMLMSEIYNYGDFVTSIGIYSSLHVMGEIFENFNLGIFSGTKINLKNAFDSVYENKDFSYLNEESTVSDIMKNNIVSMANPAGNPSKEEGFPKSEFGYAAAFAAKTGMIILKYLVEKTDPAIIRGKQIQDLLVGALKVGEAIDGGIDSLIDAPETDGETLPADYFKPSSKALAEEGNLLPIVMFGVRPAPPIPIGDPTTPLTALGAVYLALTANGGMDSVLSSGDTSQDVIEKENPDKKCDDK